MSNFICIPSFIMISNSNKTWREAVRGIRQQARAPPCNLWKANVRIKPMMTNIKRYSFLTSQFHTRDWVYYNKFLLNIPYRNTSFSRIIVKVWSSFFNMNFCILNLLNLELCLHLLCYDLLLGLFYFFFHINKEKKNMNFFLERVILMA